MNCLSILNLVLDTLARRSHSSAHSRSHQSVSGDDQRVYYFGEVARRVASRPRRMTVSQRSQVAGVANENQSNHQSPGRGNGKWDGRKDARLSLLLVLFRSHPFLLLLLIHHHHHHPPSFLLFAIVWNSKCGSRRVNFVCDLRPMMIWSSFLPSLISSPSRTLPIMFFFLPAFSRD